MKNKFAAALLVAALSGGAIAQTTGGGSAGGSIGGAGTSGSSTGTTTPPGPGGVRTPGLPDQSAGAVSDPSDTQRPGAIPATPPPGGINQPITVGTEPGNALNTPATNRALGAPIATNTLNSPTVPGAVGGVANQIPTGQGQLTADQAQQVNLLAMQLNALRGAGADVNQSTVTIETALRQLGGQAQLAPGSLNQLSTGLANAWRSGNLTAEQQQQILSAVASTLSTAGNPPAGQQALLAAQNQLSAAGLPNTTVAALRMQLQQILATQRGAAGGLQQQPPAGVGASPAGTVGGFGANNQPIGTGARAPQGVGASTNGLNR